jgi:hypothetical protein
MPRLVFRQSNQAGIIHHIPPAPVFLQQQVTIAASIEQGETHFCPPAAIINRVSR